MGTLFLVATPIGNLEDITLRALRILKEVPLIAAEDTRHTRGMLTHFGISTPLTSYFEHNKLQKVEHILSALEQGNVALVSDAGTPTINDPGYELVKEAIRSGHQVVPIPGPSSPITALSASGLPTNAFLFLGYVPRKKKEREEALTALRDAPYTLIFLESPNRVADTLESVATTLPDRQVVIAREITKKFEEFTRGTAKDLLANLPESPKGEIVLLIGGSTGNQNGDLIEDLDDRIRVMLENGEHVKTIASSLADVSAIEKKNIYQRALEIKNSMRDA